MSTVSFCQKEAFVVHVHLNHNCLCVAIAILQHRPLLFNSTRNNATNLIRGLSWAGFFSLGAETRRKNVHHRFKATKGDGRPSSIDFSNCIRIPQRAPVIIYVTTFILQRKRVDSLCPQMIHMMTKVTYMVQIAIFNDSQQQLAS